jgi:hypothetical protein
MYGYRIVLDAAARSSALHALLLGALACTLVSCASIDSTTTRYAGAPRFPPTDPATVQILRSDPGQPHDRLGEVMIDASVDPEPPIEAVEARLRNEAAKIGADAVVVVYDRIQRVGTIVSGGYGYRTAFPVTGHRVVGIAIKYGPPPPPP